MHGGHDVRPTMPDLTERDGRARPDELGAIHVVVDHIRPDVDKMRREGTGGDRVVVLVDDQDVEPRTLQLADGTPRRQRHDRDIESTVVHPVDQAEDMLLRPAARSGREDLDDADPFAGDDRRSRHGLETRIVTQVRAHDSARRNRTRWIGSSTAPHSYL